MNKAGVFAGNGGGLITNGRHAVVSLKKTLYYNFSLFALLGVEVHWASVIGMVALKQA